MEGLRLYNDEGTINFVKLFLALVEKYGRDIVWVEKGEEIRVLARSKVGLEGIGARVRVVSLEDEVRGSFSSVPGVKGVEVKGDKVVLRVSPLPETYEQIYVTKFNLEKEYGVELELEIREE